MPASSTGPPKPRKPRPSRARVSPRPPTLCAIFTDPMFSALDRVSAQQPVGKLPMPSLQRVTKTRWTIKPAASEPLLTRLVLRVDGEGSNVTNSGLGVQHAQSQTESASTHPQRMCWQTHRAPSQARCSPRRLHMKMPLRLLPFHLPRQPFPRAQQPLREDPFLGKSIPRFGKPRLNSCLSLLQLSSILCHRPIRRH